MAHRFVSLSRSQAMFLSALLSAALLNNFRGSVKWIGFASLLMVLGLSAILLLEILRNDVALSRRLSGTAVYSVLLVGVYVLAAVMEGFGHRSLLVTGELVALLCFLFAVTLLGWRDGLVESLGGIFLLPVLFLSIFGRTPLANENTLGGFLAFILFWPIACYTIARRRVQRLIWLFVILVGFVGLIAYGARSTWIALAGGGVTYLLVTWCRRNRSMYLGLFVVVITLIVAFLFIYPSLPESSLGADLQAMSRNLTGRNFFSGRDTLWPLIISAIWERPLLGYGASATPGTVSNVTLSSHNLYLQVALQTGLLGLGALVGLLFSIWKVLWLGRNNKVVRLVAAYMTATMVHQMFEVSLTQNNLSIGIAQWLILGVGMSLSLNSSTLKESTYRHKHIGAV